MLSNTMKPLQLIQSFLDTPAIADGTPNHAGCTAIKIFVGTTSRIGYGRPLKCNEENKAGTGVFHRALLDFIQELGAMDFLFRDNHVAQVSKKVDEILCWYKIGSMRSESGHQHQNPAEQRIQDIKGMANRIME